MDYLNDGNTLISLILGVVSLTSFLLRKWIWPGIKKLITFHFQIWKVPITVKCLEKQIKAIHNLVFIAEHKADFLLNESDSAIYECDIHGKCIFVNKALENLFGLDSEDMLGDGWLQALHPDDIVSTHGKWKQAITNWIPYRAFYRVINQTTGKTINCETAAIPIKDNEDQIISFMGIVKII